MSGSMHAHATVRRPTSTWHLSKLRLGRAAAAIDREHADRRLRRHDPEGADERGRRGSRTGTSSSRLFGYSTDSYTSDSVYGFFKNGGTDCWVVRVAHNAPTGEPPGIDHAACAEHVQIDDWNKPSLKIRALNEGNVGQHDLVPLRARAGRAGAADARPRHRLGEAHVNSTRGFEVGALVRIYDRENSDYVVITEVGDKLIKWSTETPVNRRHRAAAPTYLEVMTFEIHVAMKDRREVFKGLQMHPSSKNYAPRVVSQRSRLVRLEDLVTKSPVPHNLPEALPMTRLSGGRDGIEAITPEDFIGHDLGPGERTGLLALAANEEVALLAPPTRCGSTSASPVRRARSRRSASRTR